MKKARHALKTKGTMHKLRNAKNLDMPPIPPSEPPHPSDPIFQTLLHLILEF